VCVCVLGGMIRALVANEKMEENESIAIATELFRAARR